MNIYHLTLRKTREKYLKFKKRLEKSISSGEFHTLSRRKKNQLISRVEKFRSRLEGTGAVRKGVAVAGAMALIPGLTMAQAVALPTDPLIRFTDSNKVLDRFGTNQQVEIVNLDSDADLEVVISTTSRGFIFDKSEQGEFEDNYMSSLNQMDEEFYLGDVDGDSDIDLVFQKNGYFMLALNDGEAGFDLINQELNSSFPGSFAYYDSPDDVDLVDFDGDGDLDLVISHGSNRLVHFDNDGSGSFSPANYLSVSTGGLTDFEFADLDGDGDMDLIHNQNNGGMTSRLFAKENTSGTSSIPTFTGVDEEILYINYFNSGGITLLDIDGDNDLDIFLPDNGGISGYATRLLQNQFDQGSAFSFTNVNIVGLPAETTNDVAVSDLDGDGNDDLLISFVNDTRAATFDGTELSGNTRSLKSGAGDATQDFVDIALGDLDGDGLADFVGVTATTADPNIYYERSAPVITQIIGDVIIDESSDPGIVAAFTFADFHGNDIDASLGGTDAPSFSFNATTGELSTTQSFDWEMTGSKLDLNFILSDGNKTRTEALNMRVNNIKELGQAYLDPTAITIFTASQNQSNFLGGDIDLDGDDDLIIGDDNNSSSILLNSEFGFFESPIEYEAYFKDVNLLDFDHDGDLDLLILRNSQIDAVKNDGPSFDKYYFTGGFVSNQSFGVVPGDFDNDGLEDVATISSTGDYFYFRRFELSADNRDLNEEQELPFKTSGGGGYLSGYGNIVDFAIADFDGDDNDDLLVIVEDEGMAPGTDVLFSGDGSTFSTTLTPFTALQADNGYNRIEIEDLNDDGSIDIAAFRSNGTTIDLDIMLNDGSGSFSVDQTLTTNGVDDGSEDQLTDLLFGDMDGDGTLDIITSTADSNGDYELRMFFNDGTGNFSLAQTISDFGGIDIELMDVDRDDDNDVMVREIGKTTDVFKVHLNANIAASNIALSATIIDEHLANDTQVATITVTDINPNDVHFLYLAEGDNTNDEHNNFFAINGNNLVITRDVGAEDFPTLNILVAADDGENVYEQALVLSVNDVNQAPTGIAAPLNFDEGIPSGTSIGTIAVTDDGVENVTIDLVAGDGTNDADNGSFVINGDQLILIDEDTRFESKSSYNIHVRASDIDGSIEQAFVVEVNDVNQSPTAIELETNSFGEDVLPGTAISNIIVTDPNAGDMHSLSLVDGDGSDDNDSFTIQGNQLVLIETIEFNNTNSLTVRIAADDGVEQPFEQALTLSVNEVLGLDDEVKNILGIYPNPGQNEISFNIVNDLLGEMSIHVTDLLGRTIHQLETEKSSKNWTRSLDMSSEETGVYIIEVTIGKMKVTQRWVKQD